MKVSSLGWEDPLEEGMATHSSILACRIPWTEEPGGLQSRGSQSRTQLKRLSMYTCMGCKQISAVVTRGLGEGRKAEQMKHVGFFLVCRTQ